MKSASITFRHGEPAKPFTPRTGESKLWRFVGDDFAAVLDPICHHQARAVKRCQVVEGKVAEEPPQFDHLEVWPVQWGIPDSIVTTNPAGVEKWLRKFYAHKPEAEKAEWEAWLEQIGKRLLWWEFRTPELERDWLSSAGGAGRGLSLHARKPRIGFTNPLNVDLRDLERIRFRADFSRHDELTTIYLADRLEDELTPDERRTSPRYIELEEKRLREQAKQHVENLAAHHATHAKLEVVEAKSGQTLTDLDTLKAMAGERSAEQGEWRQNPLGAGKEAIADCLLALEAKGIKSHRAVALLRYAYGATRATCATTANVSLATIKRGLSKARETPYKDLFARTPTQRRMARQQLKNPSEIMALVTRLAELDPEQLRTVLAPIIAKRPQGAANEPTEDNPWSATVDGL
jgi:DNA-directed RNA polymerase specialized sigma24 family protein